MIVIQINVHVNVALVTNFQFLCSFKHCLLLVL